ncbi:MAG: hypothetical protein R2705_20465 [Ilumatobacteraceae bacterium]
MRIGSGSWLAGTAVLRAPTSGSTWSSWGQTPSRDPPGIAGVAAGVPARALRWHDAGAGLIDV